MNTVGERQQQYEEDKAEAKAAAKELKDAQTHELKMLEKLNNQKRHLSALQNQVLRNDTASLSEDLQQVVNRRRVNSSREAQRETDYPINLFCQFVDWRNRYREKNPLPDTERQEVEFFLFLCQELFEPNSSIRSPDRSILAASAAQSSAQQPHAVQDSSAEIVTDGAAAQLAAHWETGEMDVSATEEPVTPSVQDVATGGGEQESPMDIDDAAKASHASVFAASGPHHARGATSHGPPPQQTRGAVDKQRTLSSTDVVMDIPSSLPQLARKIVVIVKYLYGNKKEFRVDLTKTVADLLAMIESDSVGSDWIECIRERRKNRPALYTADTWHDGGEPFAADTAIGSIARADHTKALDLQLSVMTPAHSLHSVFKTLPVVVKAAGYVEISDDVPQDSATDDAGERSSSRAKRTCSTSGGTTPDSKRAATGLSAAKATSVKSSSKDKIAQAAASGGPSKDAAKNGAQNNKAAKGRYLIDLLSFSKSELRMPAAAGTTAIAGGTGNAAEDTLINRIHHTISNAGSVVTPAADDAIWLISKSLRTACLLDKEAGIKERVRVLLKAIALLFGQTSGVVAEADWLRNRGLKCDLAFVLTTPNGGQMIVAIETKLGDLFNSGKPQPIVDSKGIFKTEDAIGIVNSYNQVFHYMAESGLHVSVITNFTQTVALRSRIDGNEPLVTSFDCVEDPSGQALFVLPYTLLNEVCTQTHGKAERNFDQHDLDGGRAVAAQFALSADNPFGYEHGAMTAQGGSSHTQRASPRYDRDSQRSITSFLHDGAAQSHASDNSLPADIAKQLLKAAQVVAAVTRQSTDLTMAEDEPDSPGHGRSAMQDTSHAVSDQRLWMARSVDPAAPPDCLRMREVPSLAAVPEALRCKTVDDALRLEPGIKPIDIFVGSEIGAGRFGVVREALFQGLPAAIKRIVLHLYEHNQELYRHEVHMYLRLCCLWGVAVATLLSCGMDCHDSVSIITERGSHSETWPESDVELAVASLKEIHRMGILHGDVHAKNVVFVVKDNERRALWIDFERSEFSSDTHKQRKEISRLRKCASSIRQKFESE
ncbi:hypothetical protein HK105_202351 [Polyrhizophydium stewartii]|uniref:Protein kinase domain-containing protein n=1 Tax=Polyrhizophydium stewartii TaxID=2732419 RepID=A0ABR4NEN1_9FUNG